MKCPKCGKEFDGRFCPDCGCDTANTISNEQKTNSFIPKETSDFVSAEANGETNSANVKEAVENQMSDTQKNQTNEQYQTYNNENQQTVKEKWYKKTWVVILFLIFFWPVGLFLMWRYKREWKSIAKVIVTVVIAVLVLFSCTGSSGESEKTDASNTNSVESTQKETAKKEVEKVEPKIKSITATYTGSTDEGVVLDVSNSDIIVTAEYDDASSKQITGFTIKTPATLTTGTTSTVLIEYEGCSFELSVACTTVSEDEYKAQCQDIAYSELARNPDSYVGQQIKFTGEIIQVMEDSTGATYRINVTAGDYGIWDDTVLVGYIYKEGQSRFLEDDIVTFYGVYGGLYTYESTMGASITIPSVIAEYIDLQ